MRYNAEVVRRSAPWVLLAAAPVAGYLIYNSLSRSQKEKFKKTFTEGSLSLATAFISKLIDQYRKHDVPEALLEADRYEAMAALPNTDETETTIGNEKW